MSNLSTILPSDSMTVQAIYEYWKKRGESEPRRGYLGGSAIGEECERKLWYSFRECSNPDFSGRLYRLFDRGHKEEARFVEELQGIGCEVHEVGPDGKQFEVVDFGGHFKGHADGVALGIPEAPKTWHLLEMKTSNTKDFCKLQKHGVRDYKPVHYAQMQVYMRKMQLTRALYIVVCKETDELYSERIRLDVKFADELLAKAERIIFSVNAPARLSDRPDFFKCRFCDARNLCHGLGDKAVDVPSLSCRQCIHATPERDGTWFCAQGKEFGKVCDSHIFLPSLVTFAEPTDAPKNPDGSQVIEFTNTDDNTIWQHGPNKDFGQYTSQMLSELPKSALLPRGMDRKENVTTAPFLQAKWNLQLDGIERLWQGKQEALSDTLDSFGLGGPHQSKNTESTDHYTAYDFSSFCVVVYKTGTAEIRIDTNQ